MNTVGELDEHTQVHRTWPCRPAGVYPTQAEGDPDPARTGSTAHACRQYTYLAHSLIRVQ